METWGQVPANSCFACLNSILGLVSKLYQGRCSYRLLILILVPKILFFTYPSFLMPQKTPLQLLELPKRPTITNPFKQKSGIPIASKLLPGTNVSIQQTHLILSFSVPRPMDFPIFPKLWKMQRQSCGRVLPKEVALFIQLRVECRYQIRIYTRHWVF